MSEHDAFLVFFDQTELWADFLITELHRLENSSFFVPEIHRISTFSEAENLFTQAPCSFMIVEVVSETLPLIISNVFRLKNHHLKARFVAYVPDLVKMPSLEYARTWELLFQCGFLNVTTSFEELSCLTKPIIRHFKPLVDPDQAAVDRIWNMLPWREHFFEES